jgi:hypothetical protein
MTPDDETAEVLAWLREERSLFELCQKFPDIWNVIKQDLIQRTKTDTFNGRLIKTLFFDRSFQRKPVSIFWFYLIWPLIWQRRLFMDSIEIKGFYCFYSKKLIQELAKIIGSRSCLEIAAGDGTLARFLKEQDKRIIATDNRSWNFSIHYPDTVIDCDAKEALQTYNPEIVICSWPPKNNDFERHIFKTDSVQTYILISSRLESVSGNWADYREQSTFSFEVDTRLSKLVLPPELEPSVYIFRRKPPSTLNTEISEFREL